MVWIQGQNGKAPEPDLLSRGKGAVPGGIHTPVCCRKRNPELPALDDSANHLRNGDPGQRAEVYYGGGGKTGRSGRQLQGKNQTCFSRKRASKKAAPLCGGAENNDGTDLCDPHQKACQPDEYLAGNESVVHQGCSGSPESISSQSSAFICPGILQHGERPG